MNPEDLHYTQSHEWVRIDGDVGTIGITDYAQKQLGDVLKYAEKLREVDVSNVESAAHALPIFNVFREDAPREWFTAQQGLSNAPRQAKGLFIVPKVVE